MTSPLTPERKQEIRKWLDAHEMVGGLPIALGLPDLLESHEALVEALKKFRDYYTSGINPDLDEAYCMADDALRNAVAVMGDLHR